MHALFIASPGTVKSYTEPMECSECIVRVFSDRDLLTYNDLSNRVGKTPNNAWPLKHNDDIITMSRRASVFAQLATSAHRRRRRRPL